MVAKVSWGSVVIPDVVKVMPTMREQNAPPVRTNPETTRVDRQGTRQLKLTTMDGGLGVRRGSEASKDLTRIRTSEGLWSHIFGGLFLPPVQTTQSNLINLNISTSRATNFRLTALNSTLGQTANRFHMFHKTIHMRSTSDSNPALANSSMNLTNNALFAFEGKANSTRYLVICTDGQTNDVSVCADPTASPPTLATLFSLDANDWVGAGWYLPLLGPGCMIFYGKIGGDTGLFYLGLTSALGTAPSPVVLSASRDLLGSIDTVTTSEKTAGFADTFTINGPAPDTISTDRWAADFDFSDVPDSAFIEGVKFELDWSEDGTAGMGATYTIAVDGSAAGISGRLSISNDTTSNIGSSTNRLGTNMRGRDLRGLSIILSDIELTNGAGSGDEISWQAARCQVTYRMPGDQASIPLGGHTIGLDPVDPSTAYLIAPEYADDEDSVSVPRILWKLAFSYDSSGDRPVVTLSKVPTLLSHVEGGCFAMGGVCLHGDNSSGSGKSVKRIDPASPSDIWDLQFSGGQGYTEDWGIINLWGADRYLIADVALDDQTVVQPWICTDSRWSAIGKRETIAAYPIAYSTSAIDLNQRYRHRIYPNSTQLNNTYVHQKRNMGFDPTRTDTTIVKENGPMAVTTPAFDALGPEEAIKALLTAWFLGREVSSSNTVRLRYSIDDGANFTTWTTFTAFASKSTLATPVAYRTLILEIALDHTASGTGTPSGLPLMIEGISQWKALRGWRVYFNPEGAIFKKTFAPGGVETMWESLVTLQETLPVQSYAANGVSKKAAWTGFHSTYVASDDVLTAKQYPSGDADDHYVDFQEVVQ